ncbi:ribosomal protein S18-alanine N-acetyltransferase [Streptomyces aidingensis]|uniref:Ribosomal-protein-alanine N-acetyltransferase n=1 Tax=Streptomyces aidingensis TaxID=910347 RepID=A0A1I1E933_9ACTN|nr:ribosomal protein S18-alanine N-acetyltransferase [Streptomyces aidingensis]SFB83611.1 ribosomal-protein-alanine N-acetyltransferase [Streptomyces aidingensis]
MTAGRPAPGAAGPREIREIREMRWWDLPAVVRLEKLLFPEDAWSEAMFWSELAHARGPGRSRHYVVAVVADVADVAGTGPGGALAGYAGLAVVPGDSADVQTIAVAPEHQGAGLGARLLTELLTAATAFTCTQVFLEVRTDNDPAQRLYRRFGFEPLGIRRGYYQPGNHDALVMRRDHTAPGPPPPLPPPVTESEKRLNHG